MDICYSDCCGVEMDGVMLDIGMCPRCHEHCDVVTDADGDYIPGLDDGESPEGCDDRGVDADDRSCEYGDW